MPSESVRSIRPRTVSPIKIRLIGFGIAIAASTVLLALIGAPPVLILEVFALAGILALFAIAIIIIMRGGPPRLRKGL